MALTKDPNLRIQASNELHKDIPLANFFFFKEGSFFFQNFKDRATWKKLVNLTLGFSLRINSALFPKYQSFIIFLNNVPLFLITFNIFLLLSLICLNKLFLSQAENQHQLL